MRCRLEGGRFDGMFFEGADDINLPDYLGFDQRGRAVSQVGDGDKPFNLFGWNVRGVEPPGPGESDSEVQVSDYKRTGRTDEDGNGIWEYVLPPGEGEDDDDYLDTIQRD